MKYYANCPVCAHNLMKGENGTQADIRCSRSKNLVRIRIGNGTVTVTVIEEQHEGSEQEIRHRPA